MSSINITCFPFLKDFLCKNNGSESIRVMGMMNTGDRQKCFHFLRISCMNELRSRRLYPFPRNGRNFHISVAHSNLSHEHAVGSQDEDEQSCSSSGGNVESNGVSAFTAKPSSKIKKEVLMLSLPALAGQAIEPVTQLMETAYIGRLGSIELASAGISISIFNMISKLFNIPLLSVSTSLVAEDISKQDVKDFVSDEKKQLPSVSTALLLASGIGMLEAFSLYFGSGLFLDLMGIPTGSTMRNTAQQFLSWRAIGAPAVVVSLALQGIFRGFKDTKTPVICLGLGNISSVFLFPVLMYYFRMGLTGAAVSTVLSQYVVTFFMVWLLGKKVILLPPRWGSLQFGNYVKSGGFLIGRTLSVLITMTLATSMAARQGPNAMAAHQICMQVWLAVSLLTDALSASAQALTASSFSKGEYVTVREVTAFVLKIGVISGISLAIILGFSFAPFAHLFTKDAEVLRIVKMGALFVSASQPVSSLAFIIDGIHFGVSDFAYAASSMMVIAAISSAFLLYAPSVVGLPGVWSGLVMFMALRVAAGYIRFRSKKGPWSMIWNSKKID